MKFAKLLLVLVSYIVMVLVDSISCQFDFSSFFNDFPGTIRAARDPRQDRGPVLFPQAPIGPDTSGVRVGASGYGFVPPGGRGRGVGAVGGGGPNPFNDFAFW